MLANIKRSVDFILWVTLKINWTEYFKFKSISLQII